MTPSADLLDGMPSHELREALLACGGATRWVDGMLAGRPFRSAERMRAVADEVWHTLGAADWHEAIARHPRIGAQPAHGGLGAAWSAREQGAVATSSDEARAALAEANRAYEARFGHIYIVCATGKSAEELLGIAQARLANEPETELAVAGEELRQIMQLRLAKLLAHDAGAQG